MIENEKKKKRKQTTNAITFEHCSWFYVKHFDIA